MPAYSLDYSLGATWLVRNGSIFMKRFERKALIVATIAFAPGVSLAAESEF